MGIMEEEVSGRENWKMGWKMTNAWTQTWLRMTNVACIL